MKVTVNSMSVELRPNGDVIIARDSICPIHIPSPDIWRSPLMVQGGDLLDLLEALHSVFWRKYPHIFAEKDHYP